MVLSAVSFAVSSAYPFAYPFFGGHFSWFLGIKRGRFMIKSALIMRCIDWYYFAVMMISCPQCGQTSFVAVMLLLVGIGSSLM